jgi:hypothetical protein
MRTYDNNTRTIHICICLPILELKKQCDCYRSKLLDYWPAKADFRVNDISDCALLFVCVVVSRQITPLWWVTTSIHLILTATANEVQCWPSIVLQQRDRVQPILGAIFFFSRGWLVAG